MAKKRKLKRGLLIVILLLGLIYLWQFNLINYGIMQLRGQLRVVNGAIPLEEYLESSDVSAENRTKVQLALEIRDFAFNELGINYSENYTTIFDQKDDPLMWVVTACDPFAFRPRRWKFPIVGSFPYKGYFSREKAAAEARRIRDEEGLDVGLRTAGGWSTLGWFKDPILSNMLRRSEGDLASLLIHELTHGTLFVKDSVTFNENLASFIGDKGAIMFMESKYGKGSEKVVDYQNQIIDEEQFKEYILSSATRLDSLYKAIGDRSLEEKKVEKESLITDIKKKYNGLEFLSSRYLNYFDNRQPNNTFFMSFLRYNSQSADLEKELNTSFQGDLKKFLEHLKKTYPSL